MNRAKKLKEKLKNNLPVIGTWLTIGHPQIAEILAHFKEFDFVCIDMEHTAIDSSMNLTLISVIQGQGKAAIVRVPKNDEVYIKKALDAGADGIIVPMIKSADEVIAAKSYTFYPPEGNRGVGLMRANFYSKEFDSYKSNQPDNILFIIQIEHEEAVNNLKSILEVPGIDATIIGPYDLSASIGLPGDLDNPLVKTLLDTYEVESLESNVPKGSHVVEPDMKILEEKIDNKYQFLAFGVDFLFMMKKIDEELYKMRKSLS